MRPLYISVPYDFLDFFTLLFSALSKSFISCKFLLMARNSNGIISHATTKHTTNTRNNRYNIPQIKNTPHSFCTQSYYTIFTSTSPPTPQKKLYIIHNKHIKTAGPQRPANKPKPFYHKLFLSLCNLFDFFDLTDR